MIARRVTQRMVRGRRNMSVWESGNDVKMLRKKYYENHTQGKSGCDRWIRGRMEWTMSLKESIGGPLWPHYSGVIPLAHYHSLKKDGILTLLLLPFSLTRIALIETFRPLLLKFP